MKKLFILGSTRGLGKEILKLAINEDFEIRCLVRDPQKVQKNKNLKIFKGDATNINDLRNSLGDSEYVISSLNVMRKNIFPWSKITNSKNTVSDSIKNIIKISNERKIYRIISVSAIGVGESINEIPYWFKLLINKSNIKFPYIDHLRQEEELKNSKLDWTILRPAALVNFGRFYEVLESYNNNPKVNLFINRKSLAKYILKILDSKAHYGKIFSISKK
tara:strand:+ start:1621 stop:2277 length:657 start_codon:yes stop_codon:yes gene_type:complete